MTISKATDYLGKIVTINIDRPLHSKHPKHGFVYELNYGFVPDSMSPDGEELDAYIIGQKLPLKTFKGLCTAIIHRTNDDDDKLIIIPIETVNISDEEIRRLTDFQEKYFESVIIRDNY